MGMTTDEQVLVEVRTMHRLEVTWLDNDKCEHSTVVYTNFEITDEAAELLLEAHGKSVDMDIDSPLRQEITSFAGLE